jgi:hypothetical protein
LSVSDSDLIPDKIAVPSAEARSGQPEVLPAPEETSRPGPPHLVVVMTRAITGEDKAPQGAVLVTRFWHPRDRCWSENYFESIDHALRLFVDESGWTLLQRQGLAGPHEHELIFEARRTDFSGPSTEEILHQVGLTPQNVADLLNEIDPKRSSG